MASTACNGDHLQLTEGLQDSQNTLELIEATVP